MPLAGAWRESLGELDLWRINSTLAVQLDSGFHALPSSVAVSCMRSTSRSQGLEDLALLQTLHCLAGGRAGRYVEIGAFDGITFSNTYALEQCLGWGGDLIEGNPQNYALLQRVRLPSYVAMRVAGRAIADAR